MIGKKMKKRSTSEIVFSVLNVTILLLFSVMCIYPFYYMLIYSFSDPARAISITILPKGFTLSNYAKVFQLSGIGRAALVSLLRTIVGTVITLGCCSFFGYLVTKEKMVGRKFIYRMFVITMYVDGGLVPTYLVMQAYGFVNSYWVYLLPTALSAYNVILIKTFMEQLPASLEESAHLDGAGVVRCWWSIILPLSKPILATIAVFASVTHWNSWFDAHIYIMDSDMWTLQYILYRFLQQIQELAASLEDGTRQMESVTITPSTIRMTITAVVTIPILTVYPFMQRYFMKGILLGAVKG